MPVSPAANYLAYRTELEGIDEILQRSGLDDIILDHAIGERRRQAGDDAAFHRGLAAFIRHTRSAFRIGILRAHKGSAAVRALEITLADSPLEQWFCFVENFDQIKAPGKSTIDRAKNMFSPEVLDAAFAALLQKAASAPGGYDPPAEQAINLLGLEVPADLTGAWYDSTCHCPDIHFPVDWVQLGDCCRTLLKATLCIRRHGVKNRMAKGGPEKLLHDLNGLNIALGNARRRKDSKSLRKKILREMKRFSGRMAHHARAHRELLDRHRAEKTDLTEAQAAQITGRIDRVLAVLPKARKQAHERIIGGRRVRSDEKVISVYEPAARVIVRGKSGAEVEFGNQLVLGENTGGLIVYREALRGRPGGLQSNVRGHLGDRAEHRQAPRESGGRPRVQRRGNAGPASGRPPRPSRPHLPALAEEARREKRRPRVHAQPDAARGNRGPRGDHHQRLPARAQPIQGARVPAARTALGDARAQPAHPLAQAYRREESP